MIRGSGLPDSGHLAHCAPNIDYDELATFLITITIPMPAFFLFFPHCFATGSYAGCHNLFAKYTNSKGQQ